jgi:hypothetical protein
MPGACWLSHLLPVKEWWIPPSPPWSPMHIFIFSVIHFGRDEKVPPWLPRIHPLRLTKESSLWFLIAIDKQFASSIDWILIDKRSMMLSEVLVLIKLHTWASPSYPRSQYGSSKLYNLALFVSIGSSLSLRNGEGGRIMLSKWKVYRSFRSFGCW